jgi:hypothetical protein
MGTPVYLSKGKYLLAEFIREDIYFNVVIEDMTGSFWRVLREVSRTIL